MYNVLTNRILVEIGSDQDKIGNILLARSRKSPEGMVVSLGPDVDERAEPSRIKIGNKIIYRPGTGTEITLNKKKHLVLQDTDIEAVHDGKTVVPCFGRVAIKPVEKAESTTSFGLIVPDSVDNGYVTGHIVAAGMPGLTEDGKVIEKDLHVGDLVAYNDSNSHEVEINGMLFTIVNEADILGILD